MNSLLEGLEEDRKLMKLASEEIKKRGRELAQAEADYQRLKYSKALEMKASGMSATMIVQIIKGEPDVSLALFKRDCAQANYQSALEAINLYKLDARLLEAQISREWNEAGRM